MLELIAWHLGRATRTPSNNGQRYRLTRSTFKSHKWEQLERSTWKAEKVSSNSFGVKNRISKANCAGYEIELQSFSVVEKRSIGAEAFEAKEVRERSWNFKEGSEQIAIEPQGNGLMPVVTA